MTTRATAYLTPAQVSDRLNVDSTFVVRAFHRGEFAGAWQDGRVIRIPEAAVGTYVSKHTVGRAS